jgi:acetyl esterase
MPLAPLFAERMHYFAELPLMDALAKFEQPVSAYVSPAIAVEEFSIKHESATVPVLAYRPYQAVGNLPVLIWLHGGGFRMGSYKMTEADVVSREMAHRAGIMVVNVEYRLVTDELKFPAPQDDCMAVLDWVVKNSERLGIDAKNIFVGGVSAGGCLAAAMAVADRDNGNHYIKGQLLNCAVLHKALPPLSEELQGKIDEINGFGLTAQMIDETRSYAVGGDVANAPDYWWAGELEDLSGLPPAQIINCEYDALRASGEKFAKQLQVAGIDHEQIGRASCRERV